MQTTTSTVSLHQTAVTQNSWLRTLVRTESSWVPALARVALGVVMLPHGLQKSLGWFGGYGFTNTMQWFTGTLHVPWIFGFAAIVAETIGALALITGFATRIAAAGTGAVFVTAIAMVHAQHGFFMNWSGAQKGEGLEYFILGLTLVAIVLIKGAGSVSVDRLLSNRTA
jgi:putative oxidoreductase